MQLNEIHDNHEHASTSLKVILLVFVLVLVGTLGYLVWDFNRTEDITDYSTPSIKKASQSNENSCALASGYIANNDPTSGLTFSLPEGWSFAGTDEVDGPIGYPNRSLLITANNAKERYIAISVSEFDQINSAESFKAKLIDLQKVFTTKSTGHLTQDANKQLSFPDSNAATFAYSKPEYIENCDGTLRGVLYFANVGQDRTGELSAIASLTDNKKKVVNLVVIDGDLSDEFTKTYKKTVDSSTAGGEEWEEAFNKFYTYVKSLNTSSNSEKLIKNYKSIYQPIVESFQLK